MRKARRLAAAYDDLEERIEALLEQEELARRCGPTSTATRSRAALGIRPGPVLGRAYKYLLELRMDEGPVGPDVARERLLSWWAEQPESQGEPAPALSDGRPWSVRPTARSGTGLARSVRTGIRLGSTVRVRRPEGARPCQCSRSPDRQRRPHRRSPSRCLTAGTPCRPSPTCCGPAAPAPRATRWRWSCASHTGPAGFAPTDLVDAIDELLDWQGTEVELPFVVETGGREWVARHVSWDEAERVRGRGAPRGGRRPGRATTT